MYFNVKKRKTVATLVGIKGIPWKFKMVYLTEYKVNALNYRNISFINLLLKSELGRLNKLYHEQTS